MAEIEETIERKIAEEELNKKRAVMKQLTKRKQILFSKIKILINK